jgi:hypothetical protein
MTEFSTILCDGCGQPASSEHIARRVQRLEWATRYRPIHLQTLLLGDVAPANEADFLYSPHGAQTGQAAELFAAAGIDPGNKTADAAHSEFQRRGLFVTYVVECPLNSPEAGARRDAARSDSVKDLLGARLPKLFTRIRRSLKPKRLVLISEALTPMVEDFAAAQLGCELVCDNDRAFALDSPSADRSQVGLARLREILVVPAAR